MPSLLLEGSRGDGHAHENHLWSRPGTLGADRASQGPPVLGTLLSLVLQAGCHGSKDREKGGEKPSAQPCLKGKAERQALKSWDGLKAMPLRQIPPTLKSC